MAEKRDAEAQDLEPRTYKVQRVLGQGSFGVVLQAEIAETTEICAIKSIKSIRKEANGDPAYTRDGPDREVQILKELNGHPNIVVLKGAFLGRKDDTEMPKLNLVFEFLSDTLHRVIKHLNQLQKGMDPYFQRLYFYHLMRGLAFMHGKGIAHCDLKPQNLLLDGVSHELKICDFGTAKRLALKETRALYICSRYYRSPEIILGSTCYNTAIDLWSAGCIFAEMIIRQPLFSGGDGVDQLIQVIKVVGTPTPRDLKAMNPNYPEYEFTPRLSPIPWHKVLSHKENPTRDACELVGELLKYDPTARLPPLEVMLHQYFDALRVNEKPEHRRLFTFVPDELLWCTQEQRDRLIPKWCRPKDGAR